MPKEHSYNKLKFTAENSWPAAVGMVLPITSLLWVPILTRAHTPMTTHFRPWQADLPIMCVLVSAISMNGTLSAATCKETELSNN
jgi:hypothetical protein